ncbi:MAG: hypothetical protein WCF67_24230 [Chitinophagaceae bacterium]
MRISILFLSTLTATTVAMLLSFTSPVTGSKSYTGTIGCAPVSKSKPAPMEKSQVVVPAQWFVDKNMSDNDLTSNPEYLKSASPSENDVPASGIQELK